MRPMLNFSLACVLMAAVLCSQAQTRAGSPRAAATAAAAAKPVQTEPLVADPSLLTNVWHEAVVGSASIGYDKDKKSYVARQYRAQVFGPPKPRGLPSNDPRDVCSKRGLAELMEVLEPGLRSIRSKRPAGNLSDDEDKKKRVDYDAEVTRVVRASVDKADQTTSRCLDVAPSRNPFAFALVLRDCYQDNAMCAKPDGIFAGEERAMFFGDLSDWMDARNGVHPTTRVNYSVAVPPTGIYQGVLGAGANPAVVVAHCKANPNSDNCFRVNVLFTPVVQPERGPNMEPKQAQPLFEHLVEQARTLGKKVESHVARTTGVPQEVAIRVLDALDDPIQAMRNLASIPNASLRKIQDELARARIRDCSLLQGKESADVGACAGYVVSGNALQDCLGGRACVPMLAASGKADVLMNLATGSMKTLATMNHLPRLQDIKPSAIEARGSACYDKHKPPPNATPEQLKPVMACMGELTFGSNEQEVAKCFLQAPKDWAQARKCLQASPLAQQLPPEAQQALDCAKLLEAQQGASDSTLCLFKDRIPESARKGIACLQGRGGPSVEACLSELVEGDAKVLKACWDEAKGDWGRATMCAMEKGLSGAVPREVAQAFRCAVGNNTAAGIGTCMIQAGIGLGSLPPWQQKLIQCAGESSGDPLGTTVCMAINDGLTADQRIALQCIASTGGEMSAAATCAFGRMALKEFANCANQQFGEGKCFGKNNEIVKLLRAIGIDVSSDTVIGQLLNVPLDMFKKQIQLAQGIAGAVGSVGNAVNDVASNISTALGRLPEQLLQGAAQVPGAVVGGIVGGAAQVIEAVGSTADNIVRGFARAFGF